MPEITVARPGHDRARPEGPRAVSRVPHDEEQEKLEIDFNQPVLVLWRRCYDQRDHILDLTHRIVVGDRYELVYRYDSTT
ncbi:MAG: UTRA domain-containing protein [Pseudonocardiaceae bacterium]